MNEIILVSSRTIDGAEFVVDFMRQIHSKNEGIEFYVRENREFDVVCELESMYGSNGHMFVSKLMIQAETSLRAYVKMRQRERPEKF